MTLAAGAQGHAPSVLIQPIVEDGYVGHAPAVLIKPLAPPNPEAARYKKMWEFDRYREISPGEKLAMKFLAQARPDDNTEAIDFGCGTGRGALMLALFGKMRVTMLDFADNCLDPEVAQALVTQPDRLTFRVADLLKPSPVYATYGYCCDVMEHIAPEDVQTVLKNILAAAQHVFFSISTLPDQRGPELLGEGEHLHLTVQPLAWWQSEITKAGAIVHWVEEVDGACNLYCTGWKDAAEVIKDGHVNTDLAVVEAQSKQNILDGWKHATPYDRQDREVVLLAGGPSLGDHLEEIRRFRAEGAALITTNGAYNWALEQGLKPSLQIVVDAREFNSRFTKPVIPDCLYLMASQVHPKTLEGLPHERTFLWHSGVSAEVESLVREKTGHFFPVPGGSTVVLRAIPLLRMLGFWRIHIIGFDSCVRRANGTHHAYAQSENDEEHLFPVDCGGRHFVASPWMIAQASEFRGLVRSLGDEVELDVMGDGLIAHMVQTGAELAALEEA